MPGSALEFRCHSHSLFGLLRATAAKDTTVVAEPEVRIRVQVTDNQRQKRRSVLRVRKSWPAQSNFKGIFVGSIMAAPNPCVWVHRHEIMTVTSQKKSVGWLDDNSVLMNTFAHVDHSKGNPRSARRTGGVKAESVAGLGCVAETPLGSFRGWKRHDSATGPENLRCRGRSLGTCSDEILPASERGHQGLVLLGTPIP
jgi:hypothetical protein